MILSPIKNRPAVAVEMLNKALEQLNIDGMIGEIYWIKINIDSINIVLSDKEHFTPRSRMVKWSYEEEEFVYKSEWMQWHKLRYKFAL